MEEELFALKWNNHQSTFLKIIKSLRFKNLYADATLACDGKFFSVHKFVLSTCSDYFDDIFHQTSCKNPVIVLKDIDCKNVEYLLDYMYVGEINVKQNELASLVSVAECLKIKGLAVPDEDTENHSRSNSKYDQLNNSDFEQNLQKPRYSYSAEDKKNTNFFNKANSRETENNLSNIKIKVEPNDTLVPLISDDDGNENDLNITSNSNKNGSQCIQQGHNFYEEKLNSETSNFSNLPGPSYLQMEMQSKEWNNNQIQRPLEGFSTQRLNSEAESELPIFLSPGHHFLSSKSNGFKRLKKKLSQIKNNKTGFARKVNYICPHCSYSCNDKSNFKRHVQIHTGEKPYHCPFCRYSSIHSSNLKTHIRNKHANDVTEQSQPFGHFSSKDRISTSNITNLSSILSPVHVSPI